MFSDKARAMVVGFEINKEYSQISYCALNQSMPDTLSLVNGEEEYNIPTAMIAKKIPGSKESYDIVWSVGREIRKQELDSNSVLIDDFLSNIKNDKSVIIDNQEFAASEIIKIFVKKCLAFLSASGRHEDIVGIAFTLDEISETFMTVVKKAFPEVPVLFLNKQECFYQYMLHQPAEMWVHDCLLFELKEEELVSYRLEHNPVTRPVVFTIEEKSYSELKKMTVMSETKGEEYDESFKKIIEENTLDRNITTSFLIGDGFTKEWCKESLKELCHHSRAFGGNNLYSKGACYCAREKVMPSTLSTDYAYLGKDKLTSNIGMYVNDRGEDKYLPLLNAGNNWYEAKYEGEFMLAYDNKLRLNIMPLMGGMEKRADITLDYFQIRKNHTNRINLKITMKSKDIAHIEIKDLGFGEIFPAKPNIWQDNIIVS